MPRAAQRTSVVVALAVTAAVFVVSTSGCGGEHPAEAPEAEAGAAGDVGPVADPGPSPGKVEPKPRVTIDTRFGRMTLELFPRESPAHVDQFLDLAASGFYDGTTFHRVIPGFLIQGGDPNTKDEDPENDGYGGLEDRRLELEVSDRLTFRRGTLGMARDFRLDGASCQFFITVGRASHIDGAYTIMGRVIAGLDVLDAIAGVEVDEGRHPVEPVVIDHLRVAADPRGIVEPSDYGTGDMSDGARIDGDARPADTTHADTTHADTTHADTTHAVRPDEVHR